MQPKQNYKGRLNKNSLTNFLTHKKNAALILTKQVTRYIITYLGVYNKTNQ